MESEPSDNNIPEVECHPALKINEILHKIVDSLDVNDLCSFSRTCKQNWAISKNHFERKYFMKYLIITQQPDEKIKILNEEPYTRHFMQHIQNIILRANVRFGSNLRAFRYFGQNCYKHLREIRFEYIHFNGDQDQLEPIQEHLKSVETVVFTSCHINGNIYSNFLVLCPKIRHLVFARTEIHCNDANAWLMTGDCLRLESFHLKIRRKTDCVYWNRFFEQNPNVARLTTILLEGDHPVMRQMCRQIASRADKLKRLCLSVSEDFELDAIEGELKDLNDKASFEQLEMEFDGSHITNLMQNDRLFSTLNKFKGIYLDTVAVRTGLFPSIDKIASIKTLNWEYIKLNVNVEYELVWRIEKPVENLENILFGSSQAPIDETIRFFLCKSPKLKRIVVYGYLATDVILGLDEHLKWCSEMQFGGERLVDIFVCHRRPGYVKLSPATNNNKRLFKLNIFTDEQRYNFFRENPFIQHLDPRLIEEYLY